MKFSTCVEPKVFNKVFDGCPRSLTAGEPEQGEAPEPGELVVLHLDRDEMLRVFGKVGTCNAYCCCAMAASMHMLTYLPQAQHLSVMSSP